MESVNKISVTFSIKCLIIIRSHHSITWMQLIVIDWVRWSVCQSVCLSQLWALQKWLNWSRCHFGDGPRWAQGTMC